MKKLIKFKKKIIWRFIPEEEGPSTSSLFFVDWGGFARIESAVSPPGIKTEFEIIENPSPSSSKIPCTMCVFPLIVFTLSTAYLFHFHQNKNNDNYILLLLLLYYCGILKIACVVGVDKIDEMNIFKSQMNNNESLGLLF